MKIRTTLLLPLLPVLAAVSCSQTGGVYGLGSEDSWAIFTGLAGLARDADPGTGTHACRYGGTVSVTTTVERGERGDSSWTSGRWVLKPSRCRMIEDSPEVSLWGRGSVTFETETAVSGGGGRIRISVTGWINWSRSEIEGGVCPFDLDLESSFGTDGPAGGSADDVGACGRRWTVPLSMFPGVLEEPR